MAISMKELTQREMAQLGGIARSLRMSKKARSESARKAANARWGNNHKPKRSKVKSTIAIISLCLLGQAKATIVPVDLGQPRRVNGEIAVTSPGLNGTPIDGQTLSIDYQFNRLVHLFPNTRDFYVAIRAETSMSAVADALYPSVCGSGYVVGLNGFQGEATINPGNRMVFGPNVTEILFGLVYSGEDRPLYLTGLHFDLTLPNMDGVDITGLTLRLNANGWRPWQRNWVIASSVPDDGSTFALLLGALVALAFTFRKPRNRDYIYEQ